MKVLLMMILTTVMISSCASSSKTDSNGQNCVSKSCVKRSGN
jgi:ABC-type Fe3+-hydroxamate transport system substrate-binding protein